MRNENDRSNIPGYVSIKEAAKILGISANRVYAYVEEGRLPSAKAAHVIMIPLEAVEDFKPLLSGRPRNSVPVWRISSEENTVRATSILVRIRAHEYDKLMIRFEEIRREKQHLFPGTLARYVIEKQRYPEYVEILLIWRKTVMPDDEIYNLWLDEFKHAFSDVLDWETAQYDTGRVIMHT